MKIEEHQPKAIKNLYMGTDSLVRIGMKILLLVEGGLTQGLDRDSIIRQTYKGPALDKT